MANLIIGTNGKDRLVGTSASEFVHARADDDVLVGSGGNDVLDGGEGIDTVSYERSGPVTVSLGSNGSAGTADKFFGGEFGEAVAYQSTDTLNSIENVIGSSFNDTITGNELNNILAGLGGADTIKGGGGIDTIDYGASREAVIVDLRGVTQRGGDAQGDKLYSIENVIGSGKADSIIGNDRGNILQGGGGNDTLAGFEGGDTLDGGDGIDTADYSASAIGIRVDLLLGGGGQHGVNLGGGQWIYSDDTNDVLKSIENVIGSSDDDYIFGDDIANTFEGRQGNDILAGLGGADTLIGGEGLLDGADYQESPEGVIVNLLTNANFGGHAAGDKLSGIEGIVGSDYDDALTGDAGDNAFKGGDGDDTLAGGEGNDAIRGGGDNDTLIGDDGNDELIGNTGNDTLIGGAGADQMRGGSEADVFVYNSVKESKLVLQGGEPGYDTIEDFETGIDKLDLTKIDANVLQSGDQAFNVVSSFTGTAGELVIWNPVYGPDAYSTLVADVNGDGLADFAIRFDTWATLPPIATSDILL